MIVRIEPVDRRDPPSGPLWKVLPGPVAGEVYAVALIPGKPRGDHLHTAGGEWFWAAAGRVRLRWACPQTGAHGTVELDGVRAYVPAGVAHALEAVDGPALALALADVAHPHEGTVPWPVVPR